MISLDTVWTGIILLHAHPQAVYYNCVKFHQLICLQGLDTRNMTQEIWTDGQTG